MKKNTPKLITFGVLVLAAVVGLLAASYSTELLILEIVVLSLFALTIFSKGERELIEKLPILALAWLLFTTFIPKYSLSVKMLTNGLETFKDCFLDGFSNSLFLIGIISFGIIQLLFRNNSKQVLVFLRYITLFVFMRGVNSAFFLIVHDNIRYIVFVILLSYIHEQKTLAAGKHVKRTMVALFSYVSYILAVCTFGDVKELYWTYNFNESSMWIQVVLGALIAGVLLSLEAYNNTANLNQKPSPFHDCGWIILFWCVLCLAMTIWPVFVDWFALLILPIVLYYCYGIFICRYKELYPERKKTLLFFWSIAIIILLIFGKYRNIPSYIPVVLILLTIAAASCWSISVGKGNYKILGCFFGIAVPVLLVAAKLPVGDFTPQVFGKSLLVAVFFSVFWCFVCTLTEELEETASSVYPFEFTDTLVIVRGTPLVALGVIIFILLIV